jgi:2-aminoethylphosphonate dioxygenase
MFAMRLSKKTISDFHANGYLVVRKLFDQSRMDEIVQWVNEVQSYPEAKNKYMMYFEESKLEPGKRILSRIENIEPFHQYFSSLFLYSEIQQITSQLFAEEAILFKDKINFKMPGGSGFKAHQDVQAGWDRYAKLHITAMVSIDPCTLNNGCLEIASGSHQEGLIGEQWVPLQENALDYVSLQTAPGDAVFFDSYVAHRSGQNLTDQQRRVLYITYNAASKGDQRSTYYADKRLTYPPDIERDANQSYVFKV